MTRITRILTVPSSGGYYYHDLAALQGRSIPAGKRFQAKPVTAGFKKVREPSEALSIGLVLENGLIGWGECVSVTYGGAAGRDPVFRSLAGQNSIRSQIEPVLLGRDIRDFLTLAGAIEDLTEPTEVKRSLPKRQPGQKISRREMFKSTARLLSGDPDSEKLLIEKPLHTAVRYGTSQALFSAAALAQGCTITELICREWDLPIPERAIPLHAQCGSDRYQGAEKMIIRGLPSLPHGLVDNLSDQIGTDALELIRYVKWLKKRIRRLGGREYDPTIHLDLHGGLGRIYQDNLGKILGALASLEKAAQPYSLRIESPLVLESREDQIQALKTLREYLQFRKMGTQLVADEWANSLEDIQAHLDQEAADMIHVKLPDLGGIQNSIESVLACKNAGVETLLGGSAAETDLSARISAQIALAVQPELILAKPGMGVDEGISIIRNQMLRTLATIHQGVAGDHHAD